MLCLHALACSQAGETRCFLEELPQDTIVVGHYKAEEWAVDDSKWIINDRLGIQITVEVNLGQISPNTFHRRETDVFDAPTGNRE